MHTERAVAVSQAILQDSIAGIPVSIKDAVTGLVTPKSQNRVKTTDDLLQAMLQGLFNNTLEEKLNFIQFEGDVLRKTEEATLSRQHVTNMTKAMLENQNFIALIATITRNETKKAVDIESERKD